MDVWSFAINFSILFTFTPPLLGGHGTLGSLQYGGPPPASEKLLLLLGGHGTLGSLQYGAAPPAFKKLLPLFGGQVALRSFEYGGGRPSFRKLLLLFGCGGFETLWLGRGP